MRKRYPFFILAFVLIFLSVSGSARSEVFAKPKLDNIVKILIRYGALDIRFDEVMDLYGSIMVCDLYQEFYRNDFKWNEIRQYLRKDIKNKVPFYPAGFQYDAELQLGKYDFENSIYRFSRKTAQFSTNAFRMNTHTRDYCKNYGGIALPSDYSIVLDKPVKVIGIPMKEEDGKKIFNRMEKENNLDHIIYARFNILIVYVEPFLKETIRTEKQERQDFRKGKNRALTKMSNIRFDGRLDSIEYFEDKERTKLLYKYVP